MHIFLMLIDVFAQYAIRQFFIVEDPNITVCLLLLFVTT